jgi:hypothetical protein
VRQQAAAAARGEAYDPANKREHGGYQYITHEMWKAFDVATAAYQSLRRDTEQRGGPTTPASGPIENHWPLRAVEICLVGKRLQN